MSKKIITVSREFGSGGRYIAEQVANRLGYQYYDKEIIARVAKETGLSEKFIEGEGEYAPKQHWFPHAFVGRDQQGLSLGDRMYAAQRKIILDVAEKENCVIVGRCADDILCDRKDCLNVFICGDLKEKTERIKKMYELSEKEAQRKMKEIDKKRSIHYDYYTERKWGDARNYSIALNSSQIGYEKCIDIICELAGK